MSRGLFGLLLAAALLAACDSGAGAVQSTKPPTADEILAKPEHANVKDAHFTLTAHVSTTDASFDATGDGVIVIKPQPASKFTFATTISGQPLTFEEIIIGGKEYDLSPDNPRWTEKPSTTSNPAQFKGTHASLLGEATLKTGKAWHVKAIDQNSVPYEAWVRESDGYPLEYSSSSQGTTFVALFDRFNTGESVSAPPESEIQQ